MNLQFDLNGKAMRLDVAADRRLIDLLREDLGLIGSKEACGTGECGTCTILVDGETKLACLLLAAQIDGKKIVTIEGMAAEGELHPLQQAFVESGAVQCGFCTPGMVIAGASLLEDNPQPTDDDIRTALSGNLCRCTGYQKIVDGVRACCSERLYLPEEPQ
ncbi:MAG: (2Fe-2S)-binding [Burkholderiaceae bacterium]|nr:(2Fe-2S)-binding [Burkholderiaceae bacterium]